MEELAGPFLNEMYDIEDTASYILYHGYKRVALQFPDHLLKVSVMVSSALRNKLKRQGETRDSVQLYLLADTTYGSCCADEIAAAHVDADCIIHYGHTCLSQMSKLPVWYVFGRAMIDVEDCAQQLLDHASKCRQDLLVLFDFEYAHAIPSIKKRAHERQNLPSNDKINIVFARIPDRAVDPQETTNEIQQYKGSQAGPGRVENNTFNLNMCHLETCTADTKDITEGRCGCKQQQKQTKEEQTFKESSGEGSNEYSLGGLRWKLPDHCKMEDILIVWVGLEGPALTNVMLTYNGSAVVCYDSHKKLLLTDVANKSNILRRRYYLVERAKDANIIGIVIGTLGVAGYQEVVQKIKKLVREAGKKSYTLAVGKPTPAKLANFPECDIFVLVACAQTAMLDSKDFMAPVITPFEAVLAWKSESQWTGAYSVDFYMLGENNDMDAEITQKRSTSLGQKEPRFSFIKGGYVEESDEREDFSSRALILSKEAEKALQLQADKGSKLAAKLEAKSGIEFFASRSYHGLEIDNMEKPSQHHVLGRKGRASAYDDELEKKAD